jgi:hypothetical protein
VVVGNLDLVLMVVARSDGDEDVVAIALWRHVETVGVEVGRRPFVRPVELDRVVGMVERGEVVDQQDAQGVPWIELPGRSRQRSVVGRRLHRLGRADVERRRCGGHRDVEDAPAAAPARRLGQFGASDRGSVRARRRRGLAPTGGEDRERPDRPGTEPQYLAP